MIAHPGKSYTYSASAEAEAQINAIVSDVASVVRQHVPEQGLRALVLIGGYGRGEGGVRIVDGTEAPNNNLDFLLITNSAQGSDLTRWHDVVAKECDRLQASHGIGIDISLIRASQLSRSACRIMWYDMRFGHRTILGDPSFVTGLDHFTLESVPAWDVHNLMINRGTLLIVNDILPGDNHGDTRVRHTVKAVIGYGDAVLHAAGQYHWSYAEKKRRMQQLDLIGQGFRELYDRAMEYRFRPVKPAPREFQQEGDRIRQQCEEVHRICEQRRLDVPFKDWNHYLELALRNAIWEDSRTLRGIARSLRNVATRTSASMPLNWQAKLGQHSLSAQRLLGILFPAVAYETCPSEFREMAATALRSPSPEIEDLRRSYLGLWGQAVDRNFNRFLNRHGISINA